MQTRGDLFLGPALKPQKVEHGGVEVGGGGGVVEEVVGCGRVKHLLQQHLFLCQTVHQTGAVFEMDLLWGKGGGGGKVFEGCLRGVWRVFERCLRGV